LFEKYSILVMGYGKKKKIRKNSKKGHEKKT